MVKTTTIYPVNPICYSDLVHQRWGFGFLCFQVDKDGSPRKCGYQKGKQLDGNGMSRAA
jgi:hypothetical protein